MRKTVLVAAGLLALLVVIGVGSASGQSPGSGQGAGTGPGSGQGAGSGQTTATAGTAIFVPPTSAGTLYEPPELKADRNGVLKASVDLVRAGTPASGRSTLYGNTPLF